MLKGYVEGTISLSEEFGLAILISYVNKQLLKKDFNLLTEDFSEPALICALNIAIEKLNEKS